MLYTCCMYFIHKNIAENRARNINVCILWLQKQSQQQNKFVYVYSVSGSECALITCWCVYVLAFYLMSHCYISEKGKKENMTLYDCIFLQNFVNFSLFLSPFRRHTHSDYIFEENKQVAFIQNKPAWMESLRIWRYYARYVPTHQIKKKTTDTQSLYQNYIVPCEYSARREYAAKHVFCFEFLLQM